jgi:hypothetical protein
MKKYEKIKSIDELNEAIEAGKNVALMEQRAGNTETRVADEYYNKAIDTTTWYRADDYDVYENADEFLHMAMLHVADDAYTRAQDEDEDEETVEYEAEQYAKEIAKVFDVCNFTTDNVIRHSTWTPVSFEVVPKKTVAVSDYDVTTYFLAIIDDDN